MLKRRFVKKLVFSGLWIFFINEIAFSNNALQDYRCLEFEANPMVGDAFFSSVQPNVFYFMSPISQIISPSQDLIKASEKTLKSPVSAIQNFRLYRLDILKKLYNPILNLRLKPGPVLIPTGEPLAGITSLSFGSKTNECLQGKAVGLSALLTEVSNEQDAKIVRSFKDGEYKVIPSKDGRAVIDTKNLRIKDIDSSNFQMRNSHRFAASFIPLYLNRGAGRLIGLDLSSKPVLKKLILNRDNQVELQFPLDKDWLMAQNFGQFGFVKIPQEGSNNFIELKELPGWLDVTKESVFQLSLGDGSLARNFSYRVDWIRRKVLALSKQDDPKQNHKLVHLYDYEANKKITEFTAKEDEYVYFVDFDNSGSQIVLLTRSSKDHFHKRLMIYSLKVDTWTEASIGVEKIMEKK